jgi:hypothetical protein
MTPLVAALIAFGGSSFATLFTDTQWADVQSFLNFLVLLLLVARNERAIPRKTAIRTREEIEDSVTDNGGPSGLRDELAELVVDTIERRYQRKT